MFVKLENGVPVEWPVNENRIKHENPNVSFPNDVTKIDIAAYGYAKFSYSDPPEYNTEYQECVEITPVLNEDTYVQTWQVKEKFTAEERAEYDAKKEAELLATLPSVHRSKRDALISETDWWASSDLTMTAEQTAYRQALRDITTHVNWPHLEDSDWPVKPQ